MYIFSLVEPKYFPLRVMNIMKSITANKIFKEHSEVKNIYYVVNCGIMEVILEPLG